MFLSKAAMKAPGFSLMSADVMDANRLTTSACGSARHRAAAAAETSARLRAIARIDFDVLLREIASPETGLTLPTALDSELDLTIPGVQFLFQLIFRELSRQSAPAHGDTLHID